MDEVDIAVDPRRLLSDSGAETRRLKLQALCIGCDIKVV
jgi:hypothetical protein